MKNLHHSGFTVIEVMIYIALTAMLMVALSAFLNMTLDSQVKVDTMNNVENGGWRVVSYLDQTIRNADAVTAPTSGQSANTLTLAMADASKNPTIFSITDGRLYIKEGTGQNIDLLPQSVAVNNFTFTNAAVSGVPAIIRYQFDMYNNNANTRQQYQYTKNFSSSTGIRR
jgi:Tfp pilus assembly protein PilW